MFGNSIVVLVIFLSIVNLVRLQIQLSSSSALMMRQQQQQQQQQPYYYPARQHYEQYLNRYYSNIQNYNRLLPYNYYQQPPNPNRMLYKRHPYPDAAAISLTTKRNPSEIYLTTTTHGPRSKRLMAMMAMMKKMKAIEQVAASSDQINIINKTNGFVPIDEMEQIRRKVSTADDTSAAVDTTTPTLSQTSLIYPENSQGSINNKWKSEILLPEPFMSVKDTSTTTNPQITQTLTSSSTTTTTTPATYNSATITNNDETSTSATTAITFIQRIESLRSKRPETSTIDPQTIIDTIMRENREKNPLVVGKRPIPEVSDSLEENLKILKSLQNEQNDILKQLAFLNRLRSKQNLQSQLGSGNEQFNFVSKLLNNIEKDKSETANLQTLLSDLESKNNSKNHIYGETKEAVLAAVLKEQGIGPAAMLSKDKESEHEKEPVLSSTLATVIAQNELGTGNELTNLSEKRKRRKKRPQSTAIAADNVMIITPDAAGNEIDDFDSETNWSSARKRKRRPQQSDDGPRAQLPPLQFDHVDGIADDQSQPAALGLLGPFVQQASKSFRTVFQLGSRTIGHLFRASVSGSGTGSAAMFPAQPTANIYR